MVVQNHVLLRLPDRQQADPLPIERTALIAEIVSGRTIPPNAQIQVDGRWLALCDCPDAPWLDELVRQAIGAVQTADPARLSERTDRILLYGGHDDERAAVGIAKFLKAYQCQCDGNPREAVALLEPAARKPSCIRAAVYNNLGVAFSHLRNPAAALRAFEEALAVEPRLLVARINLRILARRMGLERAPDLPGRDSWRKSSQDAEAALRSVPAAEVLAFVNGASVFPGVEFFHVLTFPPSFPRLSEQLAVTPPSQPGAHHLLHEAQKAFSDGRHSQARLLAGAAAQRCASVKPAADELIAAATARIEEAKCLEEATAYARRVQASVKHDALLSAAEGEVVARILDHLARADVTAAQEDLRDLITTEPSPLVVAELKKDIEASRLLKQVHAFWQARDPQAALRCLHRAIRHAPRNQPALDLLLCLELLKKRSLTAATLQESAARGREAIRTFLEGNPVRCRQACHLLRDALGPSYLASYLEKMLESSAGIRSHTSALE